MPPLTLHTSNHVNCPACDAYRQRILGPAAFSVLLFRDAAPLWLLDHAAQIDPRTVHDYKYYIRMLEKFFAELPLNQIHLGHVDAYRELRAEDAGASCINHEINTLKQIMGRGGLWAELARFYRPLRLPKATVGQALEPDMEERLFEVAASRKRWRVAFWCSVITATTGAGPNEITHLHLRDIDLAARMMRIRDGLKNVHRDRTVPLNEAAFWAAQQILKRYNKIVIKFELKPDPEHFILPGRGRATQFDPWKAMGSWKKAWRSLRTAAGMPTLRMYDLRHHALTRLLEDPEVSDQTAEEVAGHIREATKKIYSHIRLKPKQDAVAKLEIRLPAQSEATAYRRCWSARREGSS